MNTCHCMCSVTHDPTPAPDPNQLLRCCTRPVEAVVVMRTAGTLAAGLWPTHEIPMCLPCTRACEAVAPRFLMVRGIGDPTRARLN